MYNQIANFVYMQSEINIKVGNSAPNEYLGKVINQIKAGDNHYSGITTIDKLHQNLQSNSVPINLLEMNIESYEQFLEERRKLMADKIRKYYKSL